MEVKVKGGELSKEEINAYIEHVQKKYKHRSLIYLEIEVDGEYVNLKWETKPVRFDRIRRITGYLVGDISRWNNAKSAEERDRVKHI